jgi:putative phage-type endonuclease
MIFEHSPEWHNIRKKGIGGSDAAAVLGISPFRSPVDVWLDKTGNAEPIPETESMRMGTELEDFVARRYAEQTGRIVRRFNQTLIDSPMIGNIDRLVVPEGGKIASYKSEIRTDTLLECKTTSAMSWEEVPDYYQVQVLHYMGLAPSIQRADVACLFLNVKKFSIFRVERDDEIINFIREKLTAWWNEYVVCNKCPAPESEADCRKIWARSKGVPIEANGDIVDAVDRLKKIKEQMKALESEETAERNKIAVFMGEADTLLDPSGEKLLTYKSNKDSSKTDWEAVSLASGADAKIIEHYTTTKPGARVFRLTAKKEE